MALLDLHTLGLSSVIILMTLALLAGGMWASQRSMPGRTNWFLGHSLTALGFFSFASEHFQSAGWTHATAFPLIVAGLLGLRAGLRQQLGRSSQPRLSLLLLALFTLSHGYLTLVYAAPMLRTTLVALFLVGVLGSLARTTLSNTRHFGRAPCMLLAMTLLTYVPMIALRALTLLLPDSAHALRSELARVPMQTYMLMHLTVAQILLCFAFEWLVSDRLLTEQQRLLLDLSTKNADLLQMATTDALTGASSRRHFLQVAAREQERALRYGYPLSLMILDVDHFKRINDSHGHSAGDEALRVLVSSLRAALRDSDCVGRLGGEEFVVLLPQTGQVGALEVAERLRQRVAGLSVGTSGGANLQVTVSIGVAEWQGREDSIERLVERADSALYRAKDRGRDRVERAERG
mgnify:CR=1 FL=1